MWCTPERNNVCLFKADISDPTTYCVLAITIRRFPGCVFLQTDRSGRAVRCMFMANVAVGKAFKTYEGRLEPDNNESPPPGFDSVVGEVRETTKV